MQVLNLDAELNISRLDADIRTLRLGEGGTTNYNDLTNKPSINSVILIGNKTTSDLNIKTSELVNDAGFITNADIPTKTSDLINDDGFQTAAQVSNAVAAAIPTDVSAFANDAGYITAAQVGNIPTKTSDLTNDSGFITSAEAPVQSVNGYTGAVSLDGANLDYSAALSINDKIDAVEDAIPTKTSDLTNDSGFITAAGVPSKTSDLINDSGFITSSDIPTDVSAFTNDAGYQTAADVNTLIQAAMPVTETIENESISSFSDGADNVPVSSLIVDIEAWQEGSGVPSPDNERVIHGWDECNINKANTNLWDEQWEIGDISGTTGENASSTTQIRTKNFIPVREGMVFYSKVGNIGTSPNLKTRYYDANKNFLASDPVSYPNQISAPMPANCAYIRIVFPTSYGTTYNNDISINYPSTDHDYHAHDGVTDTIPLGQTVYGGSLNVTTGELTVTHGYVDLGSLNWTYRNDTHPLAPYFYANTGTFPNGNIKYNGSWSSVLQNALCSNYKNVVITADEFVDKTMTFDGGTNVTSQIQIKDSTYTDANAFKTAMDGVQLVYELATPTTVQLTPTEVRTLLGNNNIFADTGNINELVYFKTGCEAIARLIEAYT